MHGITYLTIHCSIFDCMVLSYCIIRGIVLTVLSKLLYGKVGREGRCIRKGGSRAGFVRKGGSRSGFIRKVGREARICARREGHEKVGRRGYDPQTIRIPKAPVPYLSGLRHPRRGKPWGNPGQTVAATLIG